MNYNIKTLGNAASCPEETSMDANSKAVQWFSQCSNLVNEENEPEP